MSDLVTPLPDRPRLRPGLTADIDPNDPMRAVVWDQFRLSARVLHVPRPMVAWMDLFDGQRTLAEVQAVATRTSGGRFVSLDLIRDLAKHMEEVAFLDGPRFRALLDDPVRNPSCIGCYPPEPDDIRALFRGLFTADGGPGLPGEPRPDGRLRAALLPHIDFRRGNVSYAHGFKEVFERTDASLFVIVATSHYSGHRFTLTRKHFRTPLGVVPTDQAYIDRLVEHYGDGLFDDPFAHLPEHSIELEVVYLQYLYEHVRPIRIVPLLVGSFRDCVQSGTDPKERGDVRQMIEALKAAEAETPEPVCYIISGDLAHIGPKFDDPDPVTEQAADLSRRRDQAILNHLGPADPGAYFREVAAEGDARRICGLPPTYAVLEAVRPSSGRVLHYGQYVDPDGFESVSFASAAFDR